MMQNRIATLWNDEDGNYSIEQVMGLALGGIVLLGILWVFRNPVMTGIQSLITGFFGKAGNATSVDVNVNVQTK